MSRGVRDRLAHDPSADRFLCHEFADQKRLNALFNASDIAVFGSASISCQAALGTGLVMGAADEQGTTNFLVKRADQGFFYPPRDDEAMAEQLLAAAACLAERTGSTRQAHRRELAEASRWLGYDQLVQQVLDAAKTRSSGAAAAPEEPRPR